MVKCKLLQAFQESVEDHLPAFHVKNPFHFLQELPNCIYQGFRVCEMRVPLLLGVKGRKQDPPLPAVRAPHPDCVHRTMQKQRQIPPESHTEAF